MLLRRGFTFMKIMFSYYWGVLAFEKGVHAFEKRFHIFEKWGSHILNKINYLHIIGGFAIFRGGPN